MNLTGRLAAIWASIRGRTIPATRQFLRLSTSSNAMNLHFPFNDRSPRAQSPRTSLMRACSVFLGTRGSPPLPLVGDGARVARAFELVPPSEDDDHDTTCATPRRRRATRRANRLVRGLWARGATPAGVLEGLWSRHAFVHLP